jgi:stringent starvation protein B
MAATPEVPTTKPYLLRALYEWCVDNGLTPYISVVVNGATQVPHEYVRNGEIVLNVGPLAANRLKMSNESIDFSARFGGVAKELSIPVSQVAAIYARENGHGMSFEIDRTNTAWEASGDALARSAPPAEPPQPPAGGRPSLRVIK